MGIASLGDFEVRITNLGLHYEHIYTHSTAVANPDPGYFFEKEINRLKKKRLFFAHQQAKREE
ncbi:hypothetical protein [Zobellella iuensis]|uniref:Uncharacterized protein n=1 Tax=Zobellella iuensis TaxID=2803811 RepID=A0ABS1QN61_9GAMM|nr:hypothetical protein [Zobellella iuensis]MBL1376236.1 hypothetical protein [Zobellella iuensis]